jgi:sugar O-acyltransferase (sialic acid O-acetyltransferase NeuD family)
MTIRQIVILGTGGNCIDILDTINDINAIQLKYECVGFLDDNPDHWGQRIAGLPILGPLPTAKDLPPSYFIVNGIGSPQNFWKQESIIAKTKVGIERFETIIHPTAHVSKMANIGRGTVIFQNVTITSNVKIGDHVIILPNTVISHDDIIGDYSCIAGGVCISGLVTIGKSCYIGTNSSIKQNVSIGDFSLVGMNSAVLHDVPENNVVVGNPAKFLRYTR